MTLALFLLAGPTPRPAWGADFVVSPERPNTLTFPPRQARFVRFLVHGSSQAQPCIDELEVYAPESEANLALAGNGARATASSCLAGYSQHQVPHLNDGRYGNDFSWISAGNSGEWAQIELPVTAVVTRVVFSRDRKGQYADRIPTAFQVQLSLDAQRWETVAQVGSAAVLVPEEVYLHPHRPIVLDFPAQQTDYVRLSISKTNNGSPPCVDELELYGDDPDVNLADAARGAKPSASSCLEGHDIHKIEHLNDGKYTNSHSWIAAEVVSWAQVCLPRTESVRRLVFSRDRGRKYRDRLPTELEVRISKDGQHWTTVKKVTALQNVSIHQPLPGESAADWADRIATELPPAMQGEARILVDSVKAIEDVRPLLDLAGLDRRRLHVEQRLRLEFNPAAVRRAVADLAATFPDSYHPPADLEEKLALHEARLPDLNLQLRGGDPRQIRKAIVAAEQAIELQRSLLLANPLLDFDEVLVLKRKTPASTQAHTYWHWGQKYGMTVNWSCDFRPKNPPVAPWWEDEIAACSLRTRQPRLRAIFSAKPQHMIQHPELHFDAKRLLLSMPGPEGAFQVFEVGIDGGGLRQITKDTGPDVDNGDPCYLPDGRIIFNSTRGFQAVPCEDGSSYVANLCITDSDGRNTRMLTFDQESNWYPTVLNNGRVLYTRYEYANISHQFGRLLFHMNPDGTGQMEYYGSNSYWPNSIFYTRPVPGHPTMVVGVVCGHHGPNRTGPLVLLDPALGRHETSGAIQTIPGHGKPVKRVVADVLYGDVWPKFAHPWPLGERYFLASGRLHPGQEEYALYLVDVFDTITEICRLPGHSLFEPIPLKPRPPPPRTADRTRPGDRTATVLLGNVYGGRGLRGVPAGAVKRLRLFSYNYMYRHAGRRGFGHLATPGVDGPWEPRYVLGTVPVEEDGSAVFTVPANLPISIQPLDSEGRALQQMRSWFTAMPGEVLSCVGCHEPQNGAPPPRPMRALRQTAHPITPWRGPPRGFDFEIEVQPVLDRFCVGCHDNPPEGRPDLARKSEKEKEAINLAYHRRTQSTIRTILTPSFIALHPHVRRPHAESNYAAQAAAEFTADTSPLVQMLKKGHHGVTLDAEGWDRLYTWIDLGAPDHGSWKNSEWGVPANYYERRLDMLRRFADRTDDVEWVPPAEEHTRDFEPPRRAGTDGDRPVCPGWPFGPEEARRRQAALSLPPEVELELADGLTMRFVLIPPGRFVMGEASGPGDERQTASVNLESPFYLSRHEVTNAQYAALVDRGHRSGHISWRSMDWRGEGYSLDAPDHPVVRVSWRQARAFCRTLAGRAGRRASLPTEAQWEWACRAGTDTSLWYGETDADFSKLENLAGRETTAFAFHGKRKWYLRDERSDDGALTTAAVGSYQPNPWGLHDMAGNVSEWTRTEYRSYPYNASDGRNEPSSDGGRVVRGGSWYDRPNRARSAFRWRYPPWMTVHNVGFRVALAVEE